MASAKHCPQLTAHSLFSLSNHVGIIWKMSTQALDELPTGLHMEQRVAFPSKTCASSKLTKKINVKFVCVCVCAHAHGGKRHWISLKLGLWTVVNLPI